MLEAALGAEAVLAYRPDLARYLSDETGDTGTPPALILRPRDTMDVSDALRLCHDAGQRVVVQGGRTGLAGGACPQPGEIVLSLERLTDLEEPDPLTASIVAGAGVPLQRLQERAEAAGLFFGVDLGARGTATLGGMIATNAGGIRVLRYGMMRAQVLGVEAVLADGTVLDGMVGLVKDNSGYDLKQLFIGSEGTLGVVTRARLALHPAPREATLAFCAVDTLAQAQALLVHLRGSLGASLSAFEAIWGPLYDAMAERFGNAPLATGAGLYLLIEAQAFAEGDAARFEEAMAAAYEAGHCADVILSQSLNEVLALWGVRENCSEFVYTLANSVGHDVSLPLARLETFLTATEAAIRAIDPAARIFPFGHLGDGNLHYIVDTTEPAAVSQTVFRLSAQNGGAISAEHGLGLKKAAHLPLVRDAGQIATMRALKAALDPQGILNMGRILAVPKAADGPGAGNGAI
nr:FAD-binding oxidoreductase [Salipiger pentaromativorans]